jgi:hypothetical protein
MRLLFAAFLIAIGVAAPALADDAPPPGEPQSTPSASGGPDFLFGHPRASISFGATWVVPRAGGDLFTRLSVTN